MSQLHKLKLYCSISIYFYASTLKGARGIMILGCQSIHQYTPDLIKNAI